MLVVAFFVSRSFFSWPFSLLSPFTGFWVFFPLDRFSVFFGFCHSTFTRLHAWFFVSLVSFAMVSFAFAFSARFVQSLRFSFLASVTFLGVRYSLVLLVWPFVDHTVGSFLLVSSVCCSKSGVIYSLVFLVVFSTRVFSVISRFSVACVAGVIRFLGCLVFFFSGSGVYCFLLLVYRAFAVARVLNLFSCLCVLRFQLLVCLVSLAARVSSVFSCSCVERFQSIVCSASSVQLLVCRAFFTCFCVERFSLARVSGVFGARVSNVFSCSCVVCFRYSPVRRRSTGRKRL